MLQPRADAVQVRLVGIARPPGDVGGVAGKMHHMLAGAAAGLQHVAGFAGEEFLQDEPDRRVIAVERRSVQPAVGFDWPAILAEFRHIFRHGHSPGGLLDFADSACKNWPAWLRCVGRIGPLRVHCDTALTPSCGAYSPHCQPMAFMLLTPYIRHRDLVRERPLIAPSSTKPATMKPAMVLPLLIGVAFAGPAWAQSAAEV